MPEFACRVGTPSGEVRLEIHVAPDADALRQDLVRRELHVFEIKPRGRAIRIGKWQVGGRARAVSRRQFLLFNQEMVVLLRAGLPVLQCLEVLLERMPPGHFRRYVEDVRDRVQGGSALSEAFLAQGEAFPRVYGASLTAGERSGELSSVMARYVDFAKKTERMRTRVTAALLYPAVLVGLSVGLIALLMFWILPRFSSFYMEFGQELPQLTVTIVSLTRWLQEHALIIGTVVVVGTFAGLAWKQTDAGAYWFDAMRLRVPVIGRVVRMYNTAQFARTLSTLLAGGIPLVTSLQTATGAMGNRVFIAATAEVAEDVRQGRSLWESIERTGVTSDLTVEMVKVGEATGSLSTMLGSVADFYDEQLDDSMTRIVSLFEPILLLTMGIIVAFLLLAMYLPIFRLAGSGAT